MLAAVPIAHQPCGANGVQLCVARDGSATATATVITPTRTADNASWNPDETRRPSAFAPKTTVKITNPTLTATDVLDPVRSAT